MWGIWEIEMCKKGGEMGSGGGEVGRGGREGEVRIGGEGEKDRGGREGESERAELLLSQGNTDRPRCVTRVRVRRDYLDVCDVTTINIRKQPETMSAHKPKSTFFPNSPYDDLAYRLYL